MILSKCLDKDIHKQFSNGGNYYGPPVGYKVLFINEETVFMSDF